MGQTYSYQPPAGTSRVGVASFDPAKMDGDWWVIGVTPVTSSGTPNLTYDEGSTEHLTQMKWNSDAKKVEFVSQGYKDGQPNPYTQYYAQYWPADPKYPAWMKLHHNGKPGLHNMCINWTNYDQFALISDFTVGAVYFQSRKRKLSPTDMCMLNSILKGIGINPQSIRWNQESFDKSVEPSGLKGDGLKVRMY